MSCICFGGVCVPYSAILPFLLIALQYLLKPLYNLGLIPDFIARRLGLTRGSSSKKATESSCTDSTCCADGKTATGATSAATTTTTKCDFNIDSDNEVTTIESSEEYQTTISKYDTVIIKFTAEWCKPCKIIHPFYADQLAKRYTYSNNKSKFVIIDVDELDDVAGECDVSVLPCFMAVKNGKVNGKYTGSDETKLESFVKEQMM